MSEIDELVKTSKPLILLATYMSQPIPEKTLRNICANVLDELLKNHIVDLRERLEFLQSFEHYEVDKKDLKELEEKIAIYTLARDKTYKIINKATEELLKEGKIIIDDYNRVSLQKNVDISQYRNGVIEKLIRSEIDDITTSRASKVFEIDGEVYVNLLNGRIQISSEILEEFLNSHPEIVDKFSEFLAKKIARKT